MLQIDEVMPELVGLVSEAQKLTVKGFPLSGISLRLWRVEPMQQSWRHGVC